jgi:uncharacterized integral membrane protein
MSYKSIVSLVLVGIAVLFILQNVAVVEFRFLFWRIEMSRALMFFLVLSIGFISGWSLHGHFPHKQKH